MSDRNNHKRSHNGIRRNEIIPDVKVEETFTMYEPSANTNGVCSPRQEANEQQSLPPIGEGCYISAVYKNRRFYGILIEQSALHAGTVNYFQDQADSLSMNQRMQLLLDHNKTLNVESPDDTKMNIDHIQNTMLLEEIDDQTKMNHNGSSDTNNGKFSNERVVQKFKFIPPDQGRDGYRILLATYTNILAASEDHHEKAIQIYNACECGGNFVGPYYYQYQTEYRTLQSNVKTPDDVAYSKESNYMSTSISLDTFLKTGTLLPSWHPLKNSSMSQSKILSLFNMKMDTRGILKSDMKKMNLSHVPPTVSNRPRFSFRVCVVGGGIAGLACAEELLRLTEKSKKDLNLEVVILEARDRLGGRIFTDYDTFKDQHGNPIPVDLGASWIHGIEKNPIAIKANDFNLSLIATSDKVKMLDGPMSVVDEEVDKKIDFIFNQMLDDAADYVWKRDNVDFINRRQVANRWYASTNNNDGESHTDVPIHRFSSDISMALAMDQVKNNDIILSEAEHRLLMWHQKNTEYAFGASLGDISMKYWDLDENDSFEGDHAMIKEGFSTLLETFVGKLRRQYGDRLQVMLDYPVKKIDYGYDGNIHKCMQTGRIKDAVIDISDSCAIISSKGGEAIYCDFVVSTLPLGVLKRGIASSKLVSDATDFVEFSPSLSEAKVEAIKSLGFGLLNKIMLQFPYPAFWRASSDSESKNVPLLSQMEHIFGNASAVRPSYYMFYDLGRCCEREKNEPAILMALISGEDAAKMEALSEGEIKDDVLNTLRVLFSDVIVPDPVRYRVTKWGSDKYSRGCYSFLAPGSTPEDYDIMRNPCCKNGDAFLCQDTEIMRLYWAGEHTSKEFPSVAHGAFLSGVKAAQEIFQNIYIRPRNTMQKYDSAIPFTLYRALHPRSPMRCILCEQSVVNDSYGNYVAFFRNPRYYLVHMICALNSPEVEYSNGRYRNVISAIQRGRQLKCHTCGQAGATVGCIDKACKRSFHVPCCGPWNFTHSKEFLCTEHNASKSTGDQQMPSERPVSLQYFRERNPNLPLRCTLCNNRSCGDASQLGGFVMFERSKGGLSEYIVFHKQCLLFSDVNDTVATAEERPSVFDVFNRSRPCSICKEDGATARCSADSCLKYFHFPCCQMQGWLDFDRKTYLCSSHVLITVDDDNDNITPVGIIPLENHGINHNLLCQKTESSV